MGVDSAKRRLGFPQNEIVGMKARVRAVMNDPRGISGITISIGLNFMSLFTPEGSEGEYSTWAKEAGFALS
ncbi:MAG: hypothetical protein DI634_10625 [Kocuria palustris]|nr:MAG: hypothetical protein DI634_10625 [Kocuria palustris]